MVGLYINNNTRERFADAIIRGLKSVETRTKRACKTFLKSGIRIGERFAIVSCGKVRGYATFQGVKDYANLAAFRADFSAHKVAPGSAYDFDPKRGKVGILLSDVVAESRDIRATRACGYTYTRISADAP